jgi:hypothetical protein
MLSSQTGFALPFPVSGATESKDCNSAGFIGIGAGGAAPCPGGTLLSFLSDRAWNGTTFVPVSTGGASAIVGRSDTTAAAGGSEGSVPHSEFGAGNCGDEPSVIIASECFS